MSALEFLEEIDSDTFDYLRTVLQEIAGIALSETKADLLVSRLRKRLIELQMNSLTEYVDYLKSLKKNDQEWQVFLNCLTTNKTDFFREADHFIYLLEQVLPEWLNTKRNSPLRVWSVPCSTGEEPYTLAMILNDAQRTRSFEFTIAASDIDTKVLPIAKNGVYRRSRLVEIPSQYHKDSFSHGTEGIKDWISIKQHLRNHIRFQQCNLIAPPFPWNHTFDVIFCRNVLIYFSPETINQVIRNLYDVANPGAYLFVGHSEALHSKAWGWERIHPSIYRKKTS